jgi:hypothetical protein
LNVGNILHNIVSHAEHCYDSELCYDPTIYIERDKLHKAFKNKKGGVCMWCVFGYKLVIDM